MIRCPISRRTRASSSLVCRCHLGALDLVYTGVITSTREVAAEVEETDPVTNDLLISQLGQLEQFHWFIRAHLENAGGKLSTASASTETEAAKSAKASK